VKSSLCQFLWVALLITGSLTLFEAAADDVDVVIGGGIVISPGYNDVLNDAYPEYTVTGGYGWMDLLLAVQFNASEQLAFTAGTDLFFNYVSGDLSFSSTIVLPSVSVLYKFKQGSSIYVSGQINCGFPSSSSSRIDLESDGVGAGGTIGWASGDAFSIEAGYVHVPVTVNDVLSENFGGGFGRCRLTF